jgi:ADP-heptose:LPS heptosyltransferase
MAAILERSALLITNDTGISHLADALRVRSIVVFANDDGTRAARWAPLDRSRHATVIAPSGAPWDEAAREIAGRARRSLARVDRSLRMAVGHHGAVA